MSEDLKLLLKRVRLQRYKEGSPQKILAEIYHDLSYSRYGRQAWDILVELIADRLRPMELEARGISLLPETKHRGLADKFSELLEAYIVAAKQNPWKKMRNRNLVNFSLSNMGLPW